MRKDPWWTKVAWLKKIVRMPDQKYFIQVTTLMACFMLAGMIVYASIFHVVQFFDFHVVQLFSSGVTDVVLI